MWSEDSGDGDEAAQAPQQAMYDQVSPPISSLSLGATRLTRLLLSKPVCRPARPTRLRTWSSSTRRMSRVSPLCHSISAHLISLTWLLLLVLSYH